MNEYERNIQQAQAFRDQTSVGYEKATQATREAQSAYDNAFSSAPDYGTVYSQYKDQFTKDPELENLKNSYMLAKDNADSIRTQIDKLGDSINQQFGGTSLTEAQREMFKQKQLMGLQSQFTQYNANYNVSFKSYKSSVDRAFKESIDVANKSYDSYWDIVRIKYNTWNERIKNQSAWSSSLNRSNLQLDNANFAYNQFKRSQQQINVMRELELSLNRINREYITGLNRIGR